MKEEIRERLKVFKCDYPNCKNEMPHFHADFDKKGNPKGAWWRNKKKSNLTEKK